MWRSVMYVEGEAEEEEPSDIYLYTYYHGLVD